MKNDWPEKLGFVIVVLIVLAMVWSLR